MVTKKELLSVNERGCVPPWGVANIITFPSFMIADVKKLAVLKEEGNQH